MAFRKRPAEGEAIGGFRGVTVNGDALDPTQGPPSGSRGSTRREDPYASRDKWDQVDRGSTDNSGAYHDE